MQPGPGLPRLALLRHAMAAAAAAAIVVQAAILLFGALRGHPTAPSLTVVSAVMACCWMPPGIVALRPVRRDGKIVMAHLVGWSAVCMAAPFLLVVAAPFAMILVMPNLMIALPMYALYLAASFAYVSRRLRPRHFADP